MPGIFCIEEEADECGPCNRGAAYPVLAAAQCLGGSVRHTSVCDAEEFFCALDLWAEDEARHKILYLSLHGEKGSVTIGREIISLDRIAQFLDGRGIGCHAHLSSCDTLAIPIDDAFSFLTKSGLDSVSGFKKSIHIRDAAAFEILLMDFLLRDLGTKNLERALAALERSVPDLSRSLGFRMVA